MADLIYTDIVKLAEQLPEPEQNKLIAHLRAQQATHKVQKQPASKEAVEPFREGWYLQHGISYADSYRNPTREELIQELAMLHAVGAFDNVESLYGKYANSDVPDMSAEAFHAELNAEASEFRDQTR